MQNAGINEKDTVFIVGIHSAVTGAMFDIWCFGSSVPNVESSHVANTSKLIKGFDILAENSLEELQLRFLLLQKEVPSVLTYY